MQKHFCLFFIWFGLSLFYSSVFVPQIKAEPAVGTSVKPVVNIGVVGPLTGKASVYGLKQLKGVMLAVEEANKSGYLPFRLNIIKGDDHGESSRVGEIARDMVFKDKVAAFIGCVNSSCTHVLEMICVKVQKPQITTVSTDPSITRAGSPWIFRCLADDRKQAKAIVSYIVSQARSSFAPVKVAMITLDNRYGKMGAFTCKRLLKQHSVDVCFDETINKGDHNRDDIAYKIKRSNPSIIVLWSLYNEAAQVMKSLQKAGLKIPVIAPDGVTNESFLKLAGSAAEGMVVTFPFNRFRKFDHTGSFLKRFKLRFNEEADSFAAHAYDGMKILALAMKRGGIESFALKDNLALTSNFNGVTGIITFDASGNDTRDVELAIVKDGRFIPLR